MLAQERSINHEHRRGPYGISVPRTRDAPDGNMPMMTCCYRVKALASVSVLLLSSKLKQQPNAILPRMLLVIPTKH